MAGSLKVAKGENEMGWSTAGIEERCTFIYNGELAERALFEGQALERN